MPLPRFSDDAYLNYCVVEALMLKARGAEIAAQKEQEINEWKSKPVGSI